MTGTWLIAAFVLAILAGIVWAVWSSFRQDQPRSRQQTPEAWNEVGHGAVRRGEDAPHIHHKAHTPPSLD